MYLTFMEFIKSESGICLLLAIGCVIFAVLLIFLIIRDRREKQESYTKLNLENDIKAKKVVEEVKVEEKPVEVKKEPTKKSEVKKPTKAAATKKPATKTVVEKKPVEEEKVEKPIEVKQEEKPVEAKKTARVTNYHVSKHPDGGWQVKRAGAERALKKFKTQAEAIAFAKEKSENQDNNVVIHKKSGHIRKQDYSKK